MTPGQKKKALAAITSILGNIKVYFPNTERIFLEALADQYSEVHALAVAGGTIKAPAVIVPAPNHSSSIFVQDCPHS